MRIRNIISIRAYKYFLFYLIAYSSLLIFELNILYSNTNYFNSLNHIYSNEEIFELIKKDKSTDWINFVIVPLYIMVISFITALTLEIFKFLFDFKFRFRELFKVAIISHIVFLFFYFLNVALRYFLGFNLVEGEINYFSLATLVKSDIPIILLNFLTVFDAKAIIYMLFLALIVNKQLKINYKIAFLYTFISMSITLIFYVTIMSIFGILIL